jgi:hypothetical protein
LRNRIEFVGRFEDSSDENFSTVEVSHALNYRSRIWDVNSRSTYYNGDDTPEATIANGAGKLADGRTGKLGRYEEAFENRSTFTYYPTRAWGGKVETDLYWGRDSERRTVKLLRVRQEMAYRFFKGGRSNNTLGEIEQEFEYIGSLDNSSNRSFRFTLSGEYFPTARNFWSLGTRVDYYYYDNLANTVEYDLWSTFDFTKLQVDLNYKYGSIDGSKNVAHRYEVNVKKLF